jgi:hypothetical protein
MHALHNDNKAVAQQVAAGTTTLLTISKSPRKRDREVGGFVDGLAK